MALFPVETKMLLTVNVIKLNPKCKKTHLFVNVV